MLIISLVFKEKYWFSALSRIVHLRHLDVSASTVTDVSLFLVNVMDRRQCNVSERQLGHQHTTCRQPDTDHGPTDELQMLTVQLIYLMLVLSDRVLKADGTVPNLLYTAVAYRRGGLGCSNPPTPRNSEVLTKSNRIAN
jgi:hypothetical protein